MVKQKDPNYSLMRATVNRGEDAHTDGKFDIDGKKKTAKQIVCIHNGQEESIGLTVNDLVFVTNGSCTERAMIGDQNSVREIRLVEEWLPVELFL